MLQYVTIKGDNMKFKELKEQEPLEVVEVTRHMVIPNFPGSKSLNRKVFEDKKIQMRIFTDGEIAEESEETQPSLRL